jgi:NAD(P)-dependent dehydrogenase (short-subunit alcohol dehydrogenase family)
VAGIGAFVPLADLDLATWRRVLDVNLTGAYLLARAAAPHLAAAGGAIVTIGSTRAHQSEPHGEAYAASKGGLLALTHALAVSLGPRVRVNAVSPGWIEVGDRRRRGAERRSSTATPTASSTRWAASACPRTWRRRSPTCCRPRPASSPGRRSWSTAA